MTLQQSSMSNKELESFFQLFVANIATPDIKAPSSHIHTLSTPNVKPLPIASGNTSNTGSTGVNNGINMAGPSNYKELKFSQLQSVCLENLLKKEVTKDEFLSKKRPAASEPFTFPSKENQSPVPSDSHHDPSTSSDSDGGNSNCHGEKNPSAKKKRGRKCIDKTEFVCHGCKTKKTPEWRKGPDGRNTLCNACGIRWSKKLRQAQPALNKMKIATLLN
eukprot:TRINITY_DN5564_c0_g5_i2.p1 TRINITY_DN5564_c0_g5~~TRINITY_DN5564_c0_g5_i2.p1  ORF type:complete len:219 (+),score=45.42 TRINITY_DN5564_c0_g5_i2:176-832(+)